MSLQTVTRTKAKPFPRVRKATPDDFVGIMDMCHQLYAENGAVGVDWMLVQNAVIQAINGEQASMGVIGAHDALEGMIYLRISHMWYSADVILEELFNFVAEPYRRSKNAQALLEFARSSADKLECPLLIGVISNTKTESKVKLYSRYLGAPAGAFFLYNARTDER